MNNRLIGSILERTSRQILLELGKLNTTNKEGHVALGMRAEGQGHGE